MSEAEEKPSPGPTEGQGDAASSPPAEGGETKVGGRRRRRHPRCRAGGRTGVEQPPGLRCEAAAAAAAGRWIRKAPVTGRDVLVPTGPFEASVAAAVLVPPGLLPRHLWSFHPWFWTTRPSLPFFPLSPWPLATRSPPSMARGGRGGTTVPPPDLRAPAAAATAARTRAPNPLLPSFV